MLDVWSPKDISGYVTVLVEIPLKYEFSVFAIYFRKLIRCSENNSMNLNLTVINSDTSNIC